MTTKNPASLKISSGHYRTADLVIAIAFVVTAVVSGYFAVADGLREYWALLLVGIVGAVLMLRRARTPDRTQ